MLPVDLKVVVAYPLPPFLSQLDQAQQTRGRLYNFALVGFLNDDMEYLLVEEGYLAGLPRIGWSLLNGIGSKVLVDTVRQRWQQAGRGANVQLPVDYQNNTVPNELVVYADKGLETGNAPTGLLYIRIVFEGNDFSIVPGRNHTTEIALPQARKIFSRAMIKKVVRALNKAPRQEVEPGKVTLPYTVVRNYAEKSLVAVL